MTTCSQLHKEPMLKRMLMLGFLVALALRADADFPAALTCEPGFYLNREEEHCYKCADGTYKMDKSGAERCASCRRSCQDKRAHPVTQCTPTTNMVCQCPEGMFSENEWQQCRRHSPCPLNYGVVKPGTPNHDTVCEKCGPGYVSEVISKTEPCQPLQNQKVYTTPAPQEVTLGPITTTSSGGITSYHDLWIGVGITLAVVIPVAIIIVLLVCIWKRWRKRKKKKVPTATLR